MRPLLAIAAALAVAGCASAEPPRAAFTPIPVTDTTAPTSPEPAPEPSLSRAETAYMNAIKDALGQYVNDDEALNTEAYLEQGKEICEQAAEYPTEAVEAAIDAMEAEGDVYRAALTRLCPKRKQLWSHASRGFTDGAYTVGKDVRAGTYRTLRHPVVDCYWERSTGSGGIIANDMVTNAPRGITVTLQRGEGFTSRDCGPWVRA